MLQPECQLEALMTRSAIGKLGSPKKPMPETVVQTIVMETTNAPIAESWPTAGGKPQQNWKQPSDWEHRLPGLMR